MDSTRFSTVATHMGTPTLVPWYSMLKQKYTRKICTVTTTQYSMPGRMLALKFCRKARR